MSEPSLISCRHQKYNFIKKRLQRRLFPVKFAKFLRAPCFTEHLQWLLLKVSGFQPAILLKKRLQKRWFSANFAKFLRTSFFFDRTPLDDCFLCLSVNSETIFRILLLQSTSGKLVFYLQVAEFKPPFIYLKPLKTVCQEVNLLWSCQMST